MRFQILFFLILIVFNNYLAHGGLNNYFKHINTIKLDSKKIIIGKLYSPFFYSFSFDGDGNIYACDLIGKKILKFDNNGELIKIFAGKGRGAGEAMAPNVITIDEQGNIIVSDNSLRRISIFDMKGKFRDSFIIGTKHTQPFKIIAKSDILYFSVLQQDYDNPDHVNTIVKYTKQGKYIKSFFSMNKKISKTILMSRNKADFTIINDKIYAVHSAEFKITVFDLNGNFLKSFGKKPEYFKSIPKNVPLYTEIDNKSLAQRRKIYQKFENSFTPIIRIFSAGRFIFLLTMVKNGEYFNERQFMMDVYDLNGNFIEGSIPTNMIFLNKGQDGYYYFLTDEKFSNDNTYYKIAKYKFYKKVWE